jgi:hypothetical protein
MMNLTMRNAFFLLALFAGTVRGGNIDARIEGAEAHLDSWCAPDVFAVLYDECVVETAEGLGVVFDRRRLELRGSRDLQSCSICPPNPPKGHWCWVKCGQGSRRLTLANEDADRRLIINQAAIEAAATGCYKANAANGYPCLGDVGDLTVTIDYQQ